MMGSRGAHLPDRSVRSSWAGAGLGATAGVLLRRAGLEDDLLGLATTGTLAGVVLTISAQAEVLNDARAYGFAVALVVLVSVARGAAARVRGR